jgi:serine/threonine protein kinase
VAVLPTSGSLVGRTIAGKLELIELLGQGSMGQVYRAQHTALNKPIAIKVMRPEMKPTEEQLARFRAEAQASSRLDHPNTVQVLDFGEDGDDKLLYIAMEFLPGEELSRPLQRDGQFEIPRACTIARQILAALSAAHDSGIVHRDIKPGNIMLVQKTTDEGDTIESVKVCDFGIAKLLIAEEGVEPLTMEGVSLGTPAYAAPEQILGQSIDGRADLYATGVILYTMLAGQRPFDADSPMAMAMKHIKQPPPPLEDIRPELSPQLCSIIIKAMAKKPEERFENARQMRDALKPFSEPRDQSQHTIPPPSPKAAEAPIDIDIDVAETPSAAVEGAMNKESRGGSSAGFMTMAMPLDELSATAPSPEAANADDLLRDFLNSGEAKVQTKPSAPPSAAPTAPIPDVAIVERPQASSVVSPSPAAEPGRASPETKASADSVIDKRNPLMLWLVVFLFLSLGIIIAVIMQWL